MQLYILKFSLFHRNVLSFNKNFDVMHLSGIPLRKHGATVALIEICSVITSAWKIRTQRKKLKQNELYFRITSFFALFIPYLILIIIIVHREFSSIILITTSYRSLDRA